MGNHYQLCASLWFLSVQKEKQQQEWCNAQKIWEAANKHIDWSLQGNSCRETELKKINKNNKESYAVEREKKAKEGLKRKKTERSRKKEFWQRKGL